MKEIDNTPIESLDVDWGDPDRTGKKAKSLEQVQKFIKNKIQDLSGIVFDHIVEDYATYEWVDNRNDITDKSIYLLKCCYEKASGIGNGKDRPLFVYKKGERYVLPFPSDENLSDPIYKDYLQVYVANGFCTIQKNKKFLYNNETYIYDDTFGSIIKIDNKNVPVNFQFINNPIAIIDIAGLNDCASFRIFNDVYFASLHGCFVKKVLIEDEYEYYINEWVGCSVYNRKDMLFYDGSNLYIRGGKCLIPLNETQTQIQRIAIDTIDNSNKTIYIHPNEMVHIKTPITFPELIFVPDPGLTEHCQFKIIFPTSDNVPVITFAERLKWIGSTPLFKSNYLYYISIDFFRHINGDCIFIANWNTIV